jgi:hypothetical protein
VVNLKTVKALGLTIPPEIVVPATRVIQWQVGFTLAEWTLTGTLNFDRVGS